MPQQGTMAFCARNLISASGTPARPCVLPHRLDRPRRCRSGGSVDRTVPCRVGKCSCATAASAKRGGGAASMTTRRHALFFGGKRSSRLGKHLLTHGYVIGDTIGVGMYGKVKRAQRKGTSEEVRWADRGLRYLSIVVVCALCFVIISLSSAALCDCRITNPHVMHSCCLYAGAAALCCSTPSRSSRKSARHQDTWRNFSPARSSR